MIQKPVLLWAKVRIFEILWIHDDVKIISLKTFIKDVDNLSSFKRIKETDYHKPKNFSLLK